MTTRRSRLQKKVGVAENGALYFSRSIILKRRKRDVTTRQPLEARDACNILFFFLLVCHLQDDRSLEGATPPCPRSTRRGGTFARKRCEGFGRARASRRLF